MNEDVHRIIRQLEPIRQEIELLISRVPTGGRRNEICDAHIHLSAAIQHLVEIA